MAPPNPRLADLSDDDRQVLESWLVEFDQRWDEGLLANRVEQIPPGSSWRLPALAEMVKIDLERQWQSGRQVSLESYLKEFPELGSPGDVSADLIQAEYEVRRQFGAPATFEDYVRRFPHQAGELARLIAQGGSSSQVQRTEETLEELPEQFGRYRILKRLGQGGMGSVYLAEDTQLGRRVALKVPLFGPNDGPEARQRFFREARTAATLDHPYLCPVFDVGEIDSRLYLTMAYIEGKSLAESFRGQGMPSRQVAALVGKLALALQEAHAKGVIHRDLKPENVMIKRSGERREPVIVDFGLAQRDDPSEVRMTRSGQVMGTLAYMAPEQVRGDLNEIGPACDIYALGVILYELLTGRLPFIGSGLAVAGQILTQDPLPPASIRPDLDPRLEAICLKAMARKLSDRYASMAELAAALTGYLQALAATPSAPDSTVRSMAPRPQGDSAKPTGPESLVDQLFQGLGSDNVAASPVEAGKPPSNPSAAPKSAPISGESLEAVADAAPSPETRGGRPPWKWLAVAGGVLMLGLFAASLGGVFKFKTPDGVILEPLIAKVPSSVPRDVFVPLFSGVDLTGWKPLATHKAKWEFKDGILTGSGDKGCLFNTANSYENFHLRVEAKINDGGKGGVYFRAPFGQTTPQGDPAFGYNAQINISHKNPNRTGSLFLANKVVVGLAKSPPIELDQWFTLEIIADGPHVVVKVDGKNTANFVDLAAGPRVGRIAFQVNDSGTVVEYRKAEIKELPRRDLRLHYGHAGGGFEQVKGHVWLHRNGNYRGYFRDHARDNFDGDGCVRLNRRSVDGKVSFMHITRGNGGWLNFEGSTRWTQTVLGNWMVVEGPTRPKRTAPQVEEWVPLLNGKDLSGWQATGNKDVTWTYEGKTLVGRSSVSAPGLLLSDRADYDNVHLRLETMLCEGAYGSLFFRCGPANDGIIGNRSYAVRIGAAGGGPPSTGTLVLSAHLDNVEPLLLAGGARIPLEPNQWFPLEIKADGNHLLVLVNGKTAVEFTDANETFTVGRLGLVCHGHGVIRVRNLEVKELSTPTK